MLREVDDVLVLDPEVGDLALINYDITALFEVDISVGSECVEEELCDVVSEKVGLLAHQDSVQQDLSEASIGANKVAVDLGPEGKICEVLGAKVARHLYRCGRRDADDQHPVSKQEHHSCKPLRKRGVQIVAAGQGRVAIPDTPQEEVLLLVREQLDTAGPRVADGGSSRILLDGLGQEGRPADEDRSQ